MAFTPVRLGCPSSYDVYIADRSGETLLRRLVTWDQVIWHRTQDATSEATVRLAPAFGGAACCADIAGLRNWKHEIVVYRDGRRVWTGPLVNIRRDRQGVVTLTGRDKTAWLAKRLMRETLSLSADAADVFNYVVDHAMGQDNVPGLYGTATATGLVIQRDYKASALQLASDALADVARTAIDYTMIGPTLVAGNFAVPAEPIAILTDPHLLEYPEIELDGLQAGTEWLVGAGSTDEDGFGTIGVYGGIDPELGLLTMASTELTFDDQASADQAAKTRWELTSGDLIAGTDFVLSEDAPLTIDMAVPGAVVSVALNDACLALVGLARLNEVTVTVDAGDDGLSEQVSLSLQPVGTEAI